MRWNQVVCVAGAGVWGAHLGQLDLEFDQYGVIQSCSGNAIPLSDAITPNATLQVLVALSLECNARATT
jgi:2',3'-cyclic-nucleotide 2'-phosphodiesterase (5'-nucleotidase family)